LISSLCTSKGGLPSTSGSPDPTKELNGQNGKALYTEERLKSGPWDILSCENGKAPYTEERLKVALRSFGTLEARTLRKSSKAKMARRCILPRGSKVVLVAVCSAQNGKALYTSERLKVVP